MRRGYWTGFIMGGMVGMLLVRAYGDRMMEMVFPGLTGDEDQSNDSDIFEERRGSRPLRLSRRLRRNI